MVNRNNLRVKIPEYVIGQNRSRGRFASMQYPASGSTHGIYMVFSEYSYAGGVVESVNEVGSIGLPLPASITDRVGITIGGKELGVGGAMLNDALASGNLGDFIKKSLDSTKEIGQNAANSALNGGTNASNAASYMNYLTKSGLSSALPGLGDPISSASGEAINPHQALVFDGVDLKNYSFSWALAPQNEKESEDIHKIIKTIKAKIHPRYKAVGSEGSLSRGIFKYPNMVDIYFVGLDPNKIYTFKRSMVKGLSVDYSPNGNSLIRGANGSAPAFVNINMEFVESEIWTAEDFGDE